MSSSSTPSDQGGAAPKRLRSTGALLAANAVDGPPGGLPRVVRGARAEVGLVGNDPRVAADLHRALGMAEQVRVVALLPDEHEMGGGHEHGHEGAVGRRAGERIGADTEPADVLGAVL